MSGSSGDVPPSQPAFPDWYQPTLELLNARVPNIRVCKECNQKTVELAADVLALRPAHMNPTNPKHLGRGLEYPIVMTVCRNCGHTRLFNAFVLGIDTGNAPAP